MKPDTERKKYYSEKLHKRKNRLHCHLSKELRSKLKAKKRSLLIHKGDSIKVLRGPGKGKTAKVSKVSTLNRKVYVEGVVAKTARGKEVQMALEVSNLMLVGLEPTKERKAIFSEDIFMKKEKPKKAVAPKPDAKADAPKAEPSKTAPVLKAEAPKKEPNMADPKKSQKMM
ncbi:MAG: 50S ribosomal protein L24 [Candidatus Micrarchaeota archaeon]|nr:50S ribosomal protein L24 [Candidatus Micrarchaeota archaeon]MBU1681282.1 50S ribosomal protein L24 [Candidatus Micrarchaeota archaeon]